MRLLLGSRLALLALLFGVLVALGGGVWSYGYRQALDQVAARGASDLALAADRLVTQLQRYREFAVLMAEHPALVALTNGGSVEAAEAVLLDAADKTGTLAAFFADPSGRVLAASGAGVMQGPVATQELAQSPAFRRALDGALGADHSNGGAFDQRTYRFAAPSFVPGGGVRGVLVVVVDIRALEQDWRGDLPTVYFTDQRGEVFMTNRSELLFWRRAGEGVMVAPDGRRIDGAVRRVAGHEIWQQDWSGYVPHRALYLATPLPVIDLDGVALVDVAPARRLAALQAAVVAAVALFFGALLLLATERRRTLSQANAVLEERVAARTRALSLSNAALRREVTERQDAEAALKRAQSDLVQAGKLSALGQMSAGISHELNQPLMAIRSFADNASAFLARDRPDRASEALVRISDMAQRMGRIIRNLRAFARQESAPITRVDLVAVLQSAVDLTQTRLREADVTLDWQPPAAPIWVRGGEVRLAQVFVNLITNAADAMDGQVDRCLTIAVHETGPLTVTLADTGPGLEDPERIFEPFYTTRAIGASEGMGLGLSISYGLVQSFGGTIRGANRPTGGAEFSIMLERWQNEEQAA